MATKGGKQLMISKFFAPKNKTSEVITDEESPPRKKFKTAKLPVQFSPPTKKSKTSNFSESNSKKTDRNGITTSLADNSNSLPLESKKNSILSSPTSSAKSKLDSFRFKGDSPKDEKKAEEGSPIKRSYSSQKSFRGFTVPKGVKLTPLESQVVSIKEKYPDTLLFVECGYKYRFFGEDAETAAKELNIVAHLDHNFQTASIPTHRLHIHVRRLVAKGYKVGVVKQTETAALKAMGSNKSAPFTRELSALYTKATLIGEDVTASGGESQSDVTEATTSAIMILVETKPSVAKDKRTGIVLVSIEPNTGECVYDSFDDSLARGTLWGRLELIHPVEVIVSESVSDVTKRAIKAVMTRHEDRIRIEELPEEVFDYSSSLQALCQLYEGIESKIRHLMNLPHPVISCLGATLHYLREFKLDRILKTASNITKLSSLKEFMNLPGPTLRNLEVVVNSDDGGEKGSLFWVLNQTSTKFGARVLRHWLLHPLRNIDKISERQEMIQELMSSDATPLETLKNTLPKLPDFEKSITTIFYKRCSPFDFWSTVTSLSRVHHRLSSVCGSNFSEVVHSPVLRNLMETVVDKLSTVHQFAENICEESAKTNKKTTLLKDWSEFSDVIMRQKEIKCVELQLEELRGPIAKTLGFPSFDYTSVSGLEYLIEVKNNKLKFVPSSWTKVNSTKTCCRFRSKEGEKLFTKLQQLREQLNADCLRAWMAVLDKFSNHFQDYREAVKCLGSLDALLSLAKVANSNGYCKPEIVESEETMLQIEAGKHPIVTLLRGSEQFVPNDTHLRGDGQRVMLVTGPNMGGKSCYMRQVALIVLMAQVGSYVPADSAKLSILDAIYTRMGATDEIFSGKSSLMVEIGETADIMQQATDRSLVILDELGRGTSTHDGVAIATATLDYFLKEIKCLTIFVTHYLTLCEFENLYPENVANHHMSFIVNETVGDGIDVITFLYQLTSGNAGQSYGLNVARLASIPQPVLKKASLMSKELQIRTTRKRLLKESFKKIFSQEIPSKEDLFHIVENLK